MGVVGLVIVIVVVVAVVVVVLKSVHLIGPTEVGLVTKRFALRKLPEDNPIAFHGEAGYQAELLMPGLRFKLWPIFAVQKYPWVQVPAGEIGVVIAQVGAPLPIGAKSAVYQPEFGNFSDLHQFIELGGQKGVQRPVLPPGTLVPVHPVAFLVITPQAVYGLPVSPDLVAAARRRMACSAPSRSGSRPSSCGSSSSRPQGPLDMVGIVTVLEGEPLHSGDIASRLGGYDDIGVTMRVAERRDAGRDRRQGDRGPARLQERAAQQLPGLPGVPRAGGKIGLQHDPLLYGAYLLNPFLVRVEMVPMLVVNQGEVAVIKAFVGLPTLDTSGAEFKFGSIVRPGHRGIWQEPLRTGKYPINPRVLRRRDRADVDPDAQLVARSRARRTTSTPSSRRSTGRAARASSSPSSSRCRSTCPTPGRRR